MSPSISIVICTYNRCEQLRETLATLLKSANSLLDGDEMLIIDNNSSDATKSVVDEFISRLPIRYIFEFEQGLSAARNRALAEFRNEFLVFFDDDISVNETTISAYRRGFEAYPNQSIFGGRIIIEWTNAKPSWYRDDSLPLINGLLVHYDLGGADLKYQPGTLLPYGASFALRRDLIDTIGLFDVNLGVNGDQIGRGEETDYFERAFEAGYQGVYLANAQVGHRFQSKRMNVLYLYRYGREKGLAGARNLKQPYVGWAARAGLFTLRGVLQLLFGRRDRFYQCIINIGIERGLAVASARVFGADE